MILRLRERLLDLSRPIVMGVVNVTPDSFFDGGQFHDPAAAMRRVEQCVAEGAAIVDIGGESTRPGARSVSVAEELDRVMPVIEQAMRFPVAVSVDTSREEIIRAAGAAGVHLINDVRALRLPAALEAAAATGAAVCVMHMRGDPANMQNAPVYSDVVAEVSAFLEERADACEAAGIARERIVLDPGFGFGKSVAHNLTMLRGLESLRALGLPIMVGLSRKSLLAAITGRAAGERLAGSLALGVIAVLHGASIVRAHDVAATVDALRCVTAMREGSESDSTVFRH